MAVSAVADYYPLVQDYTVEPVGSGGTGVATSFTLIGTNPIRINGGASADLSTSPDTISVNSFGAAQAGVVPLSGGGAVNFLRADGIWAVPAGSGGYTTISEEATPLTQRGLLNFIGPAISATDNSGSSRTDITLNQFTSVTPGTVPQSGGGTTNFLRADGTWAPVSISAVLLQGSEPGTVQSGFAHIGNRMYAETGFVAGMATVPDVLPKLYLHDTIAVSTALPTAALTRVSNDAAGPWLVARKARGITGTLTATLADDTLFKLAAEGVGTGLAYTPEFDILTASADGNAGAATQDVYTDIIGGSAASGFTRTRHTTLGLLVGNQSTISTATRAESRLDVKGSIGFQTVAKTASFTTDDNTFRYLVDTSAGAVDITLLTPVGRTRREYEFVFTGGQNKCRILSLVGGFTNLPILIYETFRVYSDGTLWNLGSLRETSMKKVNGSESSAIVSTAVATNFDIAITIPAKTIRVFQSGGFALRAHGIYGTKASGTNTIQLSFYDSGSSQQFALSPVITLHNSMNNQFWRMTARFAPSGAVTGMALIEGHIVFEDTTGVDIFVPMRDPGAVINPDNEWALKGRVLWGTSDAANTIKQRCVAYYLDSSASGN